MTWQQQERRCRTREALSPRIRLPSALACNINRKKYKAVRSVADPGCLSRILIFVHPGSRISDPRYRIPDPKTSTKKGWNKLVVLPFLKPQMSQNWIILFLNRWRKTYGFGIRDPGSTKNLFRIPDPGVKRAQDPGSQIRIRNAGSYC